MSDVGQVAEANCADHRPLRRGWTIAIIALLAVASYAMSFSAVRTKSATADEPLHFVAAYMHVFDSDYRLDPEDPPLWSWLAMALVPRDAIHIDPTQPIDPAVTVKYIDRALWLESGATALAAMGRARAAMALLAPALVVLAAWCAWRLAGPRAAIVAAVLVTFDPLVLGHAPLVKNDVAITFVALALVAALVAVVRRMTIARVAMLAMCCVAAVTVKFTAMLLLPLAFVALLIHALLVRRSWRWVTAAASISVQCILVSWGAIWIVYGFHFAPTRDTAVQLDRQWFETDYAKRQLLARLGRMPDDRELNGWPSDATVRVVRFAAEHRLLPQAYVMGLLYTRGSSLGRHSYLLGTLSMSGRWYYFPAALLFKTPTATIGALIAAMVAMTIWRRSILRDEKTRTAALTAAIVGGGYFVAAMTSNMNIGVRHVMPAVLIAYVAAAVIFARAASAKPRATRATAWVLGVGLIVESVLAWPNYIAFFNLPSGASRGGIRLLADSNLDWGQDLPLLADWQAKHPTVRLYLCYFGNVPPEAYGIDYTNLPGGYWTKPQEMPTTPGVLAVSATRLQCIYLPPDIAPFYYDLRVNHQPREVLGGAIYLYDFPLK
jgi:4-amino-4-deoxy-L-arabinose transferase-like glycosyltransferase